MDAFKSKVVEIARRAHHLVFGEVVYCTNSECREWISKEGTNHPNVRKRWMVDVFIGDDTEGTRVTLCPSCIKQFFHMTEKHYLDIERGERLVKGEVDVSEFYTEVLGR